MTQQPGGAEAGKAYIIVTPQAPFLEPYSSVPIKSPMRRISRPVRSELQGVFATDCISDEFSASHGSRTSCTQPPPGGRIIYDRKTWYPHTSCADRNVPDGDTAQGTVEPEGLCLYPELNKYEPQRPESEGEDDNTEREDEVLQVSPPPPARRKGQKSGGSDYAESLCLLYNFLASSTDASLRALTKSIRPRTGARKAQRVARAFLFSR